MSMGRLGVPSPPWNLASIPATLELSRLSYQCNSLLSDERGFLLLESLMFLVCPASFPVSLIFHLLFSNFHPLLSLSTFNTDIPYYHSSNPFLCPKGLVQGFFRPTWASISILHKWFLNLSSFITFFQCWVVLPCQLTVAYNALISNIAKIHNFHLPSTPVLPKFSIFINRPEFQSPVCLSLPQSNKICRF